MSKHTPTRWYKSGEAIFQVGTGAPITDELRPGDAAFIVRAVNAHDELMEVARIIIDSLSLYAPSAPSDLLEKARAALATAREEME